MAEKPDAHVANHVPHSQSGGTSSASPATNTIVTNLDNLRKKLWRTSNRLCPTRRSCRSVFLIVALVVVLLETFAFYVILKTIQGHPRSLPHSGGDLSISTNIGQAGDAETDKGHPLGVLGQNLPIDSRSNVSEPSETPVQEQPAKVEEEPPPGTDAENKVQDQQVGAVKPLKGERRVKRILLWTYFWDRPDFYFGYGRDPFIWSECDVTACETTSDRTLYDFSDAVVFHINNLTEEQPDLPAYRHQNQRWVYFNLEPPHQTRIPLEPYNEQFNITMTYRLDSEIKIPYGKIIELSEEEKKVVPDINYAEHKKKLAAWIVSNCETNSKRELYVRELKRFMSVDIYGGCGTLECPRENHIQCLEMLRSDYKFYLAFENNLCEDYVSEMAWMSLQYDVVPVVMGGSDYSQHLPPGSYVDVKDFDSPEHLANFLKTLDFDPTKYNSYFSWRKDYKLSFPYQKTFCYLCEYLNSHESVISTKEGLADWHGINSCKAPEEYYNKFASIYQ